MSTQVLITGAGGSIGSAVAERLAEVEGQRLVLLDASEQSLFELERKLKGPELHFVLGDAGDTTLLTRLLNRNEPWLILHAAAYKHLGLLQRNRFAAIENNILATGRLVRAAQAHGGCQLLLLSTDKAAAPTSVMGATKRAAELLVLRAGFGAIRLCNVIGSAGSVLRIFEGQLAAGELLTVTDARAKRYFLDMPDAVSHILRAAREGGNRLLAPEGLRETAIIDLARALLAAEGLPERITFSGLQPGEKLQETLLAPTERWMDDRFGALRAIASPMPSEAELQNGLDLLQAAVTAHDEQALTAALCQLIPEYRPQ